MKDNFTSDRPWEAIKAAKSVSNCQDGLLILVTAREFHRFRSYLVAFVSLMSPELLFRRGTKP